jgi:hypothetical protein
LPAEREFSTLNTEGYIEEGKTKALKNRVFKIHGLGIPPVAYNASGWPSVGKFWWFLQSLLLPLHLFTNVVPLGGADLSELVGNLDNKVYGRAYDFFGGNENGGNLFFFFFFFPFAFRFPLLLFFF